MSVLHKRKRDVVLITTKNNIVGNEANDSPCCFLKQTQR